MDEGTAYERLSALDNSFLVIEEPNAYMHVGSVGVFEAGPLRLPSGGIDFERVKAATAAALPRIPRYRQKLAWVPIENHPVWVDDPSFNMRYHLRHTSLPKPGTERQLKRLAARVLSQHLDRSKPLWETWVVEGLEGDRFAIINKVHHCMIDGVSGVDLMTLLMTPTPEEEFEPPPRFEPRRAPSRLGLFVSEAARRMTLPLQAVRDVGGFIAQAHDWRSELTTQARAVWDTVESALRPLPDTPFNRPIGPHRRFDWLMTDLEAIRDVRKAFGGSVNDVVLAAVSGAVGAFLEDRGAATDTLEFRAMTPVSLREEAERGRLGNRVSVWIVELPIADPNPRRRLEKITERTTELKRSRRAAAGGLLTSLAEWAPSALLSFGARRAARHLPYHMIVTNVPGPQHPLYFVGAKMLASYPCVPLNGVQSLGVALFSYAGQVCWGFNADWELLPDLHDFVDRVAASFEELHTAARSAADVQ